VVHARDDHRPVVRRRRARNHGGQPRELRVVVLVGGLALLFWKKLNLRWQQLEKKIKQVKLQLWSEMQLIR
jgi:hypothetical protein